MTAHIIYLVAQSHAGLRRCDCNQHALHMCHILKCLGTRLAVLPYVLMYLENLLRGLLKQKEKHTTFLKMC